MVMEKYFYAEAKQSRNYMEEERAIGCGPFLIGTQMEVSEDIYSLLIVSQFRTDIIDEHRWAVKVSEDATEANLTKYM